VADDVRALTDALARDPASLAYADLAEALRRRGRTEEALGVALHGLTRNPQHADGHDRLARIYADMGDLERARLAWSKALEILPEHAGALRGLGFVLFRQGRLPEAAAALERALALDPGDEGARRALATVRRGAAAPAAAGPPNRAAAPDPAAAPPAPEAGSAEAAARAAEAPGRERPPVFRGFDRATADILLLDERGLVLAGGLAAPDGGDVSEIAAAGLAGVSGEAARTGDYLALGGWRTILAEAEGANLVVTPVGEGALILVRRDRSTPIGLALRFAERARNAAAAWLEGQGP